MERNGKQNPTHHVPRLEILLWAVWVRIMTTHARLRNRFICIEGLKDGSPTLGRHACIGLIGIHEDLRKAGSLEVGHWPVLFIDCPTANQPVSKSTLLFGHEPPRFYQELGWQRKPGGFSPVLRGDDNTSHLHPLDNVGGIKHSISLDHTVHIVGDRFDWYTFWRICLFACSSENPLTKQAR